MANQFQDAEQDDRWHHAARQLIDQQRQLIDQQREDLEAVNAEKATLQTTVQNTIAKIEKIEQDLTATRNALRFKETQLRDLQAARASDMAPVGRAAELHKQVDRLTNESNQAQNELRMLQQTVKGLYSQLQAEKKANTGRLGFMASGKAHADDEDDEEPLPGAPTARSQTTTYPTFTLPIRSGDTSQPTRKSQLPSRGKENVKPNTPDIRTKFPATKVQNAYQSFTTTPSSKSQARKRARREISDDELDDLSLSDYEAPTGPRRRGRHTTTSYAQYAVPEFKFKAVTSYDAKGKFSTMPQKDVISCRFLNDRIEKLKAIWEKNKGQLWMHEFQHTNFNPRCVTKKLTKGGVTRWHRGCEGMYACRDCAKNGRPCFTWTKIDNTVSDPLWGLSEFRLLPLHPDDQPKRKVVPGKSEARYWINDDEGVEFCVDDVKDSDSDDEYVDGMEDD